MPDRNPEQRSVKRAEERYERAHKIKKHYKRLTAKWRHKTERRKNQLAAAIKRDEKKHNQQHGEKKIRDEIVEYNYWGGSNEPAIHYAQTRPYPSNPYQLPQYTDCSGFATNGAKVGGAEDPNGFNFNGSGYTGTILANGKHISQASSKKGDQVVFGSGTGTHVVTLLEKGSKSDPMCMSHGQESGPRAYPLSVQKSAHPGQPLTFIKVV